MKVERELFGKEEEDLREREVGTRIVGGDKYHIFSHMQILDEIYIFMWHEIYAFVYVTWKRKEDCWGDLRGSGGE